MQLWPVGETHNLISTLFFTGVYKIIYTCNIYNNFIIGVIMSCSDFILKTNIILHLLSFVYIEDSIRAESSSYTHIRVLTEHFCMSKLRHQYLASNTL